MNWSRIALELLRFAIYSCVGVFAMLLFQDWRRTHSVLGHSQVAAMDRGKQKTALLEKKIANLEKTLSCKDALIAELDQKIEGLESRIGEQTAEIEALRCGRML